MDTEIEFWKSPPRSPGRDPWLWSLAVPSLLSASGLAAFAIFAIVRVIVSDVGQLDPLIIAAAVLLGIGGEIGTVFSTLEVFRKYQRGRSESRPSGDAILADWIGLGVSFGTTVCLVALAYGSIFGPGATWSGSVFGPVTLALVLLESADAYVTMMEFGFYLASYDRRFESYARSRERYVKGQYFTDDQPAPRAQAPAPLERPTYDDWLRIVESELGPGPHSDHLSTGDVQRMLSDHGFAAAADSTARRWALKARTNGSSQTKQPVKSRKEHGGFLPTASDGVSAADIS